MATTGWRTRVEEYGDLAAESLKTLRTTPLSLRYTSEVIRQLKILIVGTTFLVFFLNMALGFGATNFGYTFLRAAGAGDIIGLQPGLGVTRSIVGTMFGYAFAAKVGCGMASELGAMKINEELDAYDSEGVSVARYVVGTRVLAVILFANIAAPIAIFGAIFGAWFSAVELLRAVPSSTFFQFLWGVMSLGDVLFAYALVVCIAVTVVLVACYYGRSVSGGPAEVGTAVSRSLMVNLVLTNLLVGLGNFLVYKGGLDIRIPIGG